MDEELEKILWIVLSAFISVIGVGVKIMIPSSVPAYVGGMLIIAGCLGAIICAARLWWYTKHVYRFDDVAGGRKLTWKHFGQLPEYEKRRLISNPKNKDVYRAMQEETSNRMLIPGRPYAKWDDESWIRYLLRISWMLIRWALES